MRHDDTIFALSSGGLPSGVAVVRLSGPHAGHALKQLTGSIPEPRYAALETIRSRNGDILDRGLILFFPGPYSFTGEDCAELHVHGGPAVVRAVLEALSQIPELRSADAGEFSRRAFHNSKLDLVELEGLADLIAAETEMQRRLAAEQAVGGQSRIYNAWSDRLTHARAMIEAELDFADEDDVPDSVASMIWNDMRRLQAEILAHVETARTGEIIRDGLKIVIAGPPNAGKSSLINFLTKRDIAIVTDIPGTTRDVLTVDLNLDGYAVRLFDTAGLRQTEEPVEREGISRARLAIAEADLVLLLTEASTRCSSDFVAGYEGPVIRVGTKGDLGAAWRDGEVDTVVSTRTGEGIGELLDRIKAHLPVIGSHQALSFPSRIRHKECLLSAADAISRALAAGHIGLDIQAEHLRAASRSLERITGKVDVENLLDVIFSEFCIGK
ncbi:MAG: tRNA uridine-5-carboxymethylaminomethyl(34) synthesis GTPase MnmE [Shinella sp.]|nr:tRNA uridine-5-carboxymethylaminomethyl(34) synthesis GTPase MnmE [Shinella sp.]